MSLSENAKKRILKFLLGLAAVFLLLLMFAPKVAAVGMIVVGIILLLFGLGPLVYTSRKDLGSQSIARLVSILAGAGLVALGVAVGKGAVRWQENKYQQTLREETPLLYLIQQDKPLSDIEAAVRGGADVNELAENYVSQGTPLTEAVRRGRADVVRVLLANGAKVNGVTKYKIPLKDALDAKPPSPEVVQLLLDARADLKGPWECSPDGGSADVSVLNYALVRLRENLSRDEAGRRNAEDVVRRIIDAGADVNAHTGVFTPQYLAAKTHSAAILARLLEKGAAVDTNAIYNLHSPVMGCKEGTGSPIPDEKLRNETRAAAAAMLRTYQNCPRLDSEQKEQVARYFREAGM
ncbi:MAG: hypothetical protein JW849_02470 [Phycisphaerae bacterium]|nr:hypothetical protein [Phycisphaerae bacterium]